MDNSRFKFRVWEVKKNKYREVSRNIADTCLDCQSGKVLYGEGIEIYGEEDDKDVMLEQSTGLKDKNGKLIYEGDIVKFAIEDEDSCCGRTYEEICEICFGGGDYPYAFTCKNKEYYHEYQLFWYLVEASRHDMEVIGNIHENPELLEDK